LARIIPIGQGEVRVDRGQLVYVHDGGMGGAGGGGSRGREDGGRGNILKKNVTTLSQHVQSCQLKCRSGPWEEMRSSWRGGVVTE